MLDLIIKEITDRINDYIGGMESVFGIIAGDIAKLATQVDSEENDTIENNLVLTLVNIEEETSLKNNYPIVKSGSNVITQRSALYLNLYLLFSANFKKYDESLKHIGYILEFFQANNKIRFSPVNKSYQFDMMFSLHNISFENLNNLWVVFGGRYIPSVVFKVRIVQVQESPAKSGPAIVEVHENEKLAN